MEVRTYINQYRQVNYDTAAKAWKPDSLHIRITTDVLVTPDISANIYLRQATFNFKTGVSTTLLERHFDASRGFIDTARITSAWQNGAWVPKKKSLVKFTPTTTTNLELASTGTGFDTTSKTVVVKDGLGRTRLTQFWAYNANTHRRDSLPRTDSTFYQGDGRYPVRTRSYGLLRDRTGRQVRTVLYETDSIQTDAAGFQLFSVYCAYQYPGELQTLTRKRNQKQGPTSIQVEQAFQYFPDRRPQPAPRQTCRKYVNLNRPDSVNTHYYGWDSAGFHLAERWLYHFPNPTGFYLSNRESIYIRESLRATGWANDQTIRTTFHDSLRGHPTRIYYQIQYRQDTRLHPYARQEFEFVSPELQPEPPKPKPVTFSITPNPATAYLTITSSETITGLILTNALGQIFSVPVHNQRGDLRDVASAMYHVAAFSQGKLVGKVRIVKD